MALGNCGELWLFLIIQPASDDEIYAESVPEERTRISKNPEVSDHIKRDLDPHPPEQTTFNYYSALNTMYKIHLITQ